jgi:DNA-binding NarL/FixJ family response regulator
MARVLIVEDEWLQAESLEALLAPRGHMVCGSASTGEEAIELARSRRPDVVLMDIQLRGLIDGVEAAAQIQAACSCALVFVTAYEDPKNLERMRRLAPAAIVAKPADSNAILEAINRAIRRP